MIYFDKVSKIYSPTSVALDNVSFTVKPQEFISVVGHSGAGKTTLLKLLLAEEMPTSGKIFYESVNIHKVPKGSIHKLRRKIGAIFQDYRLLPTKTAYENVAFAMEAAGRTEKEIEADVPQALEIVGILNKANHFPGELSGGEKQRLAIARAVVNQPEVIIADEPTGNLDPINTFEIIELLAKINELGTTVILTTHNKEIVNSLDKRVITMEKGKIVRDDEHGRYVL